MFGFHSSKSDNSLFVKFHNSYTIFILIYLDDIVITGSLAYEIQALIKKLGSFFTKKTWDIFITFLALKSNISMVEIFLCVKQNTSMIFYDAHTC